jgi:exoribonuclease R
MSHSSFDMAAAAIREMREHGFDPDFPAGTDRQLAALKARPSPRPDGGVRDLRYLLWSSIDNDSSRDLDQIEFAERVPAGIRVLIGIADVDADVEPSTPIDRHAAAQTATVYTGIRTFSMLPEDLSMGLTSLNERSDRRAVVIEMVASPDGSLSAPSIYRAVVQNRAQLTYKRIAAAALGRHIGKRFSAIVTGVTPKGVFVRVFDPPAEGRLMRGEAGLDVGDRIPVTLIGADPARGFIDFSR